MLIKLLHRRISSHYRLLLVTSKMSTSSSASEVLLEDVDDKGIITLNRPKALNALNLNMIQLIYPKLKEWEGSKSLVIMKGAGDKAFCAGGDVLAVTEAGKKGDPLSRNFFREEYRLNCLIGTYHIPYVAILDGITMGGGVGLSVHGRYRIGTENTMFAMPEMAIGLFPDVGGSYFLPRLGGRLGLFLALTGHRLKGRDALKAGIVTHVCDSDKLSQLEATLLRLNSPYPEDIMAVLSDFHKESSFQKDEEFSLKPFLSQIEKCFSGRSIEEIVSNLEKDGSEWAQKQLKTLRQASPTSLKVTLEQLEQGSHLTLQECLAMEYRLVDRFMSDHDFYEGVRALLVDKDQKPTWKPATIEAASTEQIISKYFAPLQDDSELVL